MQVENAHGALCAASLAPRPQLVGSSSHKLPHLEAVLLSRRNKNVHASMCRGTGSSGRGWAPTQTSRTNTHTQSFETRTHAHTHTPKNLEGRKQTRLPITQRDFCIKGFLGVCVGPLPPQMSLLASGRRFPPRSFLFFNNKEIRRPDGLKKLPGRPFLVAPRGQPMLF